MYTPTSLYKSSSLNSGTLKDAATEKGITLVGDLLIFVSSNGVDTWVNRDLFHLDDDGL